MITITENSKIRIWMPNPKLKSGGVEVLNMLGWYLNSLGVDVKSFNWGMPVYQQSDYYKAMYPFPGGSWEEVTNDDENLVIIFPEYFFMLCDGEDKTFHSHAPFIADTYKHAQIIIWWLSTANDNIEINCRRNFYNISQINNILHCCESHIVMRDLEHYGIHDITYLQHPVNSVFFNGGINFKTENRVCYGLKTECRKYMEAEIIPRINRMRPDIIFDTVARGDFKTKNELCDMYSKAKVYIDFSWFSGREMMPREAALQDDILILANRNCAATSDYPIKPEYKVNMSNPDSICKLIIDCVDDYDTRIKDFRFFKNKCLHESDMFKAEVYSIFGPAIKIPFYN